MEVGKQTGMVRTEGQSVAMVTKGTILTSYRSRVIVVQVQRKNGDEMFLHLVTQSNSALLLNGLH